MKPSPRAPMPPDVPGVGTPGLKHAALFVWWVQRSYGHGITRGPLGIRAMSFAFWCMWWPLYPLLVVARAAQLMRPHTRYYLSPDGDCVLGISATTKGWHIADHAASHPGQKQGAKLRAAVLPTLRTAADHHGVVVYATAVNETMAKIYRKELRGLVDVGPGRPRGRKLRREPRPAPGAAPSSSTRVP